MKLINDELRMNNEHYKKSPRMPPLNLQLHGTNCHLQLNLILFATILQSWPFVQLCYNYICINDFFILHYKFVFIHNHAHMSHLLQMELKLIAPLKCQHNP